jgi:hypothetical protein
MTQPPHTTDLTCEETAWIGSPLPGPDEVSSLPVLPQAHNGAPAFAVEHRVIHEACDDWTFLIGVGLAFHQGRLHAAWAQAPAHVTENSIHEIVRTRTSTDGGCQWQPVTTLAPGRPGRNNSHGAFHIAGDTLWYFAAAYEGFVWGKGFKGPAGINWVFHNLRTEALSYDSNTDRWESRGDIGELYPLQAPLRLPSGNWIMAGVDGYGRAATMTSQQDDIERPWQMSVIPQSLGGIAETNVVKHGHALLAFIRPIPGQPQRVHLAQSRDGGMTWSAPRPSSLHCATSKIAATTLSTGQHVLLFNYDSPRQVASVTRQRDYPVIAVTAPGEIAFRAIWRLRPDFPPDARYPGHSSHHTPQWAYPYVIEHDGMLLVAYHNAKEDAWLTTIPLTLLAGG